MTLLTSPPADAPRLPGDAAPEPRHPVRIVARRTGLTPATLRAWERRYGVVTPARSPGGQRLYSDEDIERLTLLRLLTEGGRSISRVANLSLDEARALLAEDRRQESYAAPAQPDVGGQAGAVAELLRLAGALDAAGLRGRLRSAVVGHGAETFLDDVVAPFLRALGEAWAEGDLGPAQEHLASEVVEETLAWVAEAAAADEGPVLVVGTLPGEHHRLGARMVATAATLAGWQVRYLGASLPGEEIARTASAVGAAAVAVSVVTPEEIDPEGAQRSAAALRELHHALLPTVPLLVGGQGAPALAARAGIEGLRVLGSLDDLRAALSRLG